MRTAALSALVVLVTACSPSAAQPAKPPAATDVVATVGATPITLADVDQKAMQQSTASFGGMKLSQAIYEARRMAIEELVANALMDQEAKSRGIDRSALFEKEVTSKVSPVSDVEIAQWYQSNQQRVQGATLEQARQPIRQYLTQERVQIARQQFLDALRAKTTVRVRLEPPRQAVAAANSPAKGPAKAPIEMIEFSDFQCPFCQRANPTVDQVLHAYGDRIRFVYRHFPLPNHPNARPAAEAAQCAAEQGKFWPYHDKLFASGGRLSDSDLKQHAAELGLDTQTFNACVDGRKSKAQVDADLQAGEEAGVNGTPAFFINGRLISGAQPFGEFKRIIDEELESKP